MGALMPREPQRKPWSLILVLMVCAVAGLISVPLQVLSYQQIGQASKAQQVIDGQRAICQQINSVAEQVGLLPTNCDAINRERPDKP